MFDFFMNTRVQFGVGVRNSIPELLKSEKISKLGLVVDHNLLNVQIIEDFISSLKSSMDSLVVGSCTISEPTYISLDEMRGSFENKSLQAVMGIGGGSALDMAKAMAVLTNNKEPALAYRGFNMMTEPVLPIIAVPTTAGTGSEVTPNASFIDSEAKKKLGINGEAVRPKFAFLDPELTLSCPKSASVSAGIDSLVHATEAFAAKKSTVIAKFFAREGFNRVISSLPELIGRPDDVHLREEVMYGAFLSGIALMHSGTGPAAALSYPLGVHYKVPHGFGGGVFLPHIVEHNIKNGYTEYTGLIEGNEVGKINSESLLDKIKNVWSNLDVPSSLKDFGIGEKDIKRITAETMELKGALDQNPVPFYEKEIKEVLKKMIGSSHV